MTAETVLRPNPRPLAALTAILDHRTVLSVIFMLPAVGILGLFPAAWRFFAGFGNEYIEFTPRIDPVFGLYVKMMLGMGLVFQMPMIMLCSPAGIVSAGFLARNIKCGAADLRSAAVITPTAAWSSDLIKPDVPALPCILVAGSSANQKDEERCKTPSFDPAF
jgi:hypothetical protein